MFQTRLVDVSTTLAVVETQYLLKADEIPFIWSKTMM